MWFFLVRSGAERVLPAVRHEGPGWVSLIVPNELPLTPTEQQWQVLRRLTYGPGRADRAWLAAFGVGEYLAAQWQPDTIEESPAVAAAAAQLLIAVRPAEDTALVRVGDVWR